MRISQMRRGIEEFLHRHARHLGAGLLLLGGFCLFVPWFPLTTRSDYYEYCMHLAVSQGWQFGTDILATYGPLGFIGLPFYQDSTYTVLIAASVGLYWFSVVVLGGFWRSTIKQSRPPAAWIVGILLLPSLTPTIEWLPTLFVPFVLVNVLVLRHFFADGPQDLGRLMALTAVLAGFVLVKGSFSFLICMGVAIVALDQVIRWRRSPWIVLVFGASILALWIVSGQSLAHFPGYLANTADFIGGYKYAMAYDAAGNAGILALIFALASLALAGSFCWTTRNRLGWRAVWPASVFAATLLVVFQSGFVRADETHTVASCLTLCCLCALVLPLMWKASSANGALRLTVVLNGVTSIVVLWLCWVLGCGTPALTVLYDRPPGLWTLMSQGRSGVRRATAIHLQRIKRDHPLPELKEPVDYSGIDFGLAEANGLRSVVRPSVKMFAACSPEMSRRNKEYLEDASGPATILSVGADSIDGRYPTVTDSLSVLAQKSHFRAVRSTDGVLILQRRSHPLQLQLVKLDEREVGFNEVVPVPDVGTDALWVQIDIEPTLAGRVLGAVYRPPPAFMTIKVGAQKATFRLTTNLAREGMLLSPLLHDLGAQQAFYGLDDSEPPVKVSAFRLECDNVGRWCYRDRVKVVVFRLSTQLD